MAKNTKSNFQPLELKQDQLMILSNPSDVEFPRPDSSRRTIIQSLSSLVRKADAASDRQLVLPIPNQLLLLAKGNFLRLYHYRLNQQETLCTQMLCELQLPYYIKKVKVSQSPKSLKSQGFNLLAQNSTSNYLELLQYSNAKKQIKRTKFHKLGSTIHTWSFISESEILVWCADMNLHHYQIKENALNLIATVATGIDLKKEMEFIEEKQPEKKSARNKSVSKFDKPKEPENPKNFQLHYATIIGHRDFNKDVTLVLFYVFYCKSEKVLKIKCKQIIYPVQIEQNVTSLMPFWHNKRQFPLLKVDENSHEVATGSIKSFLQPNVHVEIQNIVEIDKKYLIVMQQQVLVVHKKFGKYLAFDSLYKNNNKYAVTMTPNSNIVGCMLGKTLEIYSLSFQENNKVSSRLIDFFYLENQIARAERDSKVAGDEETNTVEMFETFKNSILMTTSSKNIQQKVQPTFSYQLTAAWAVTDMKAEKRDRNICFLFQIKNLQSGALNYKFYFGRHYPKIKKMTMLAHEAQDDLHVEIIKSLGLTLGVSEEDFFYNMWKTSKEGFAEMERYLVRCRNYKKCMNELKGYIRRKNIAITRLEKVLQKMEEFTLHNAKQKLSDQNLLDYFNVIFIRRKFQIFESHYIIDEQQFTEYVNISLYDLVHKIIRQNLRVFPEQRQHKKLTEWDVKPKDPPKFNLIQVFDAFKMPLLEDYPRFLREILLNPDYHGKIYSIIINFPELVPLYGLEKIQILNKDDYEAIVNVSRPHLSPQRKQINFFSMINEVDLHKQPFFMKKTFNELYQLYATSVIEKNFQFLEQRIEMRGQKFISHSMIKADYQQFHAKMNDITDIWVYIIVLECLIISKEYEQLEFNKISRVEGIDPEQLKVKLETEEEKEIFKWLELTKEVDPLQVTDLKTCANLYSLLIKEKIINPNQVSLLDVYNQPIAKWIALFFLGDKQEKDLIFTDFMNLFEKKEHFVTSIESFIFSEHCSKIEISFLIDLIKNEEYFENKKKTVEDVKQQILGIIINGFCKKTEIAETSEYLYFINKIREIRMGVELLEKIDQMEKMRICKRILEIFNLETSLIKDVIEKPEEVMRAMMENFFNDNMRNEADNRSNLRPRTEVEAREQNKYAGLKSVIDSITITSPISVFELFEIMCENFFLQLEPLQICEVYCEELAIWQQFEEIDYFLKYCQYIHKNKINVQELIEKIQTVVLQKLYVEPLQVYEDLSNETNKETNKEFIRRVISIGRDLMPHNKIAIRENARIKIAQIYASWGLELKLYDFDLLCKERSKIQGELKRQAEELDIKSWTFILDVIEVHSEKLNYEKFRDFYRFMLLSSGQSQEEATEMNYQFYYYLTKLSQRLLELNKLEETFQLIPILNQRYNMNYELMAESMLKFQTKLLKAEEEKVEKPQKRVPKQSFCEGWDNLNMMQKVIELSQDTKSKNRQLKQASSEPNIHSLLNTAIHGQIVSVINYFVMLWKEQNEKDLQKMFTERFRKDIYSDRVSQKFAIDPMLCFSKKSAHQANKNTFELSTFQVLKMVKMSLASEKEDQFMKTFRLSQNEVYCYFLMLMGLTDCRTAFGHVQFVYYNLPVLEHMYDFFSNLHRQLSKTQYDFGFLSYSVIFEEFLDGITWELYNNYRLTNNTEDEIEREHHTARVKLSSFREYIRPYGCDKGTQQDFVMKMSILTSEAQKIDLVRRERYLRESLTKKELRMGKKKKTSMESNQNMFQSAPQQDKPEQEKEFMSYKQFVDAKQAVQNHIYKLKQQEANSSKNSVVCISQKQSESQYHNHSAIYSNQRPGSIKHFKRSLIYISQKQIYEQMKIAQMSSRPGRRSNADLKQQQASLNQMHQKQRQHSNENMLKELEQSLEEHEEEDRDLREFVNILHSRQYAALASITSQQIWGYLEAVYSRNQVRFADVLQLLNSLELSEQQNKASIFCLCQPEKLTFAESQAKKIFSLDYLKSPFTTLDHFYQQILTQLIQCVPELELDGIISLSQFLRAATKIQFRKQVKNRWLQVIIELCLKSLAQESLPTETVVQRFNQLVGALDRQYRKEHEKQLHGMFPHVQQIYQFYQQLS